MNRARTIVRGPLIYLALISILLIGVHGPSNSGKPSIESNVQAFRILIEITTTSDWTTLFVRNGAALSAARLNVTQRSNAPLLETFVSLSDGSIGLTKKKYDSSNVKVQASAILMNITETSGGMVGFEIQKGSIGGTDVIVYNYNQRTTIYITSVSDTNSGEHYNPTAFSVGTNKIIEGGPLQVSTPVKFGKLVWAFYYPWYAQSSWFHTNRTRTIDTPVIGAYDSSNPVVIEKHIRMAKSAGIDGFIISWWGPGPDGLFGSQTDDNLKVVLDVARKNNFLITIYFETHAFGDPSPASKLEQMMRYFLQTYGRDPRYYMIDGLPVIFVYSVGSQPLSVWREIINKMTAEGYKAFYIADTLDRQYLSVFQGLHTYFPLDISQQSVEGYLSKRYALAAAEVRANNLLYSESNASAIWAATITPGVDARQTTWGNAYFPRQNGNVFRSTFNAAMQSNPDWLLITTFNEWWENTHIEPGLTYGYKYLDLTTQFVANFKRIRLLPVITLTYPMESIAPSTLYPNKPFKCDLELVNTGNGSAVNVTYSVPSNNSLNITSASSEEASRIIPNESYKIGLTMQGHLLVRSRYLLFM